MLSLCALFLQCPCRGVGSVPALCVLGREASWAVQICMIEMYYDKIWKGEEASSIGCVFAGLTNIFF